METPLRSGRSPLLLPIFLSILGGTWLFADQVIEVEGVGIHNGALLVNSAARKLYAGQGATGAVPEKGLWVFDIQPDGAITATDERIYPNSPDPFPTGADGRPVENFFRSVGDMALSPDGRKLYLGLGVNHASHPKEKALVVYDLNEKGEPTGKPRAYDFGYYYGLGSLWLHPKANLLYACGHGSQGIYTLSLVKGEPSGEVTRHLSESHVGIRGSMVSNDDGTVLFVGCADSSIDVATVTPDGEIEPPAANFKASEKQNWLSLARVDRCLYFLMNQQLWAWPLDPGWNPRGRPIPQKDIPAIGLMPGLHRSLYLVLGEYGSGGDQKAPKLTGTRVARFKPDAQGNLGKPEFVSELFDGKTIVNLTADEAKGTIYVSCYPIY